MKKVTSASSGFFPVKTAGSKGSEKSLFSILDSFLYKRYE